MSEPSILKIRITDLSRAGSGLGTLPDGRRVFVPWTAPGDEVALRVQHEERTYAMAELVELLSPSPDRVPPRCEVFGRCGGCVWQHLPYELQWKTKFDGVRHALKRTSGGALEPQQGWTGFPAADPWAYRNRVQLRSRPESRDLGFYARGSRDLVPIRRCEIAREEINEALEQVRRDKRVDVEGDPGREHKVEIEVVGNAPAASIRWHWDRKHAAAGFRQVNDAQNARLVDWVTEKLPPPGFQPGEGTLLDLFGGSGNLIRKLAKRYARSICVDTGELTEDRLLEVEFPRAQALAWLRKAKTAQAPAPIDAVLDPPREGLRVGEGKAVDYVDQLNRLGARRAILVGCDPDAWARDVYQWVSADPGAWILTEAAVFDFFPQTQHVETAGLLTRRVV